ncbi:ROK family transcriptional regulator [Cellulosilyticum lentocellum]|uniref:ROK family protein n=1 Tax=Cellulosilyticum lentocellum (strain ATCC 49066 / DSM 5427 / NCIMB 11756 / RHM5) TaxID=642492 RepID=F2JSK9_CELLD|nr:ROK family transcriptional regulator [Cellulosilyticum lentocellum]ADZ81789.1 ROK family protein [Cellulosilyticum lentocellum DSM 5427]
MNKRVILKGNLIKETNYKKILKLIGKGENLTKLDIAYTLKISIPTVTTNINELKEAGIIEEVESDIYTGGRKPKIIKLIPNARISIGMSITKYKVAVAAMNLLNEVLISKEVDCEEEQLMTYFIKGKKLVDEVVEELKIPEENLLGIGISIPGTLNQNSGTIEQTNMGYKEIPLNQIYDLFDDTVYVENEANLSLLAEKNLGKYEELKNLIYIGINEGLGGGIFVNGEIYTGTSGRAGEFGHMRLVEKDTGRAYKVEDHISTRSLLNRYKQRTGENIKSFLKFEKLVKMNDPIACEILEEGIEILMMTIYNLTMVLDIQTLIIGGKVGRLIKTQPTVLQNVVNKYNEIMERLDLDITFSDIKNTTTLGAALLPILDFYKISNESET